MRMLICTIGSKRRRATLRFGLEVAKALSAETTLLGVIDKKRNAEELGQILEEFAGKLRELELPVQVRVEAGDPEDIVVREMGVVTYDLIALGALGKKRSRRKFRSSVAMRREEPPGTKKRSTGTPDPLLSTPASADGWATPSAITTSGT